MSSFENMITTMGQQATEIEKLKRINAELLDAAKEAKHFIGTLSTRPNYLGGPADAIVYSKLENAIALVEANLYVSLKAKGER